MAGRAIYVYIHVYLYVHVSVCVCVCVCVCGVKAPSHSWAIHIGVLSKPLFTLGGKFRPKNYPKETKGSGGGVLTIRRAKFGRNNRAAFS